MRSPGFALLIGALAGTFAAASVILAWAPATLAAWGIPREAGAALGLASAWVVSKPEKS